MGDRPPADVEEPASPSGSAADAPAEEPAPEETAAARARDLGALLEVARGLSQGLDLERTLLAAVNLPSKLLAYDRAAVALLERGSLVVRALSGEDAVDPRAALVRSLALALEPALALGRPIGRARGAGAPAGAAADGTTTSPPTEPEARAAAALDAYLAEAGHGAILALPLADEDGPFGVLAFAAEDGAILEGPARSLAVEAAAHASGAIRDAALFRAVPGISLLGPLARRRRPLARSRGYAWAVRLLLVVGGALALALVPYPLRVEGRLSVHPRERALVRAEAAGWISEVRVRTGEAVEKGRLLAVLDRSAARLEEIESAAAVRSLEHQVEERLAAADPAGARRKRLEREQALARLELAQEALRRTELRAPIGGVVTTPRIEERLGAMLRPGELFVELADQARVRIEVEVPEDDIALVAPGAEIAFKVDAFPERRFSARVGAVRPAAEVISGARVFVAVAEVENADGALREGMSGHAKVSAGGRSIGLVMLRRPFRWLVLKVWSWT